VIRPDAMKKLLVAAVMAVCNVTNAVMPDAAGVSRVLHAVS
jgi:hypothetical protein